MVLLRQLGLPSDDERGRESCLLFLDEGLWDDGGINLSVTVHRSETCITGLVLGVLAWFRVDDPRRDQLVEYLLREQMADGGWNCQRHRGAVHSSFHTTANVLDGLLDHVESGGSHSADVRAALEEGRDFLLVHQLYRSHRTGNVVDPRLRRMTFPPRWRHDILRGLDHFYAAGATADDRLVDAIGVLRSRQDARGRWPLDRPHPGAVWFDMEVPGQPSRWNTLRALRVLRWWDASRE
jgi:hypothetical protein